jgi:signal transduction histidine kinase
VSLRKDGRNAVLGVRNKTENELTNESLSHVFERFYRTDSSRNSEAGGHGIGLSMASAIVSAHGGKITARTSDGHDFIVTAAIPAV